MSPPRQPVPAGAQGEMVRPTMQSRFMLGMQGEGRALTAAVHVRGKPRGRFIAPSLRQLARLQPGLRCAGLRFVRLKYRPTHAHSTSLELRVTTINIQAGAVLSAPATRHSITANGTSSRILSIGEQVVQLIPSEAYFKLQVFSQKLGKERGNIVRLPDHT